MIRISTHVNMQRAQSLNMILKYSDRKSSMNISNEKGLKAICVPETSSFKPSSTKSASDSGSLKSVMCIDWPEGAGGQSPHTEWLAPLINSISRHTYLISLSLCSLTCLNKQPHLLSGQFIETLRATVIYTASAEKRYREHASLRGIQHGAGHRSHYCVE